MSCFLYTKVVHDSHLVHDFSKSCRTIVLKSASLLFAAIALSLATGSQVFGQQTVEAGVEQAVRGSLSQMVNVGRHGFRIQPVNVQRTANGVRAEGRIDHKIKGHDDWVFYVVEVQKGADPVITLDRIEYGGLFGGNGKVKLAVNWVGRKAGAIPKVDIAVKALNVALKGLNFVQRKLIGNWEPSVPVVLDGLAARVAQEAK